MKKWLMILLTTTTMQAAVAEQKLAFTHFDAHYVVFPTTFLEPDIATRYDIVRSDDRALVNVSIIDHTGTPVRANISGTTRNLLGQSSTLEFHEVIEEDAVYYLAEFQHTDRDLLKFVIHIEVEGQPGESFDFQQKMYISK